jgi:hypothetical protein
MKKIVVFLALSLWGYALNVGEVPVPVVLKGDNGGDANGNAWYSTSLKGKVHVLLYMDPDMREHSSFLLETLQKMKLGHTYSTVAIVNLAATWMPNALLESKLKSKQKELKQMEYVFDKTKYLVKKWHFKDDASNVVVLDKNSRVIYAKSGPLSSEDVVEIVRKIEYAK